MKVFTFYSDTHETMLNEWFLKTIPKDVEVNIKKIPQECATGEFQSDGWMQSMYRKVDYLIECCELEEEVFVHSDCDIQFFKSFKNEITQKMEEGALDLLAQQDLPGPVCCGFMAIRPTKQMADLFREVKEVMGEYNINDQLSLNHILNRRGDIVFDVLGSEYYSVWRSLNGVWDGSQELENIPEGIVMHHANFVEGVDLKMKCMEKVRSLLV
jgi:hypothetical protein